MAFKDFFGIVKMIDSVHHLFSYRTLFFGEYPIDCNGTFIAERIYKYGEEL